MENKFLVIGIILELILFFLVSVKIKNSKKMNPIDVLKRKILDFLVPFIEGSKEKEKSKNNGE